MPEYVILLRHGAVKRSASVRDAEQKLSKDGVATGYEVASALSETIGGNGPFGTMRIGAIRHASARYANETAGILFSVLELTQQPLPEQFVRVEPQLDPGSFWPERGGEHTQQLASELRRIELAPDTNAVAVVGHQPQLGWIAQALLKRPVPITRSEAVCIWLRPSPRRPRLLWSVAPSDPETLSLLREKVRSKMDVAKVLGALIVPSLGFPLGLLLDSAKMTALIEGAPPGTYPGQALIAAAGFLLLSLILYLATVYAYDRLLMPTRFWAETETGGKQTWLVRRPPSSAVWVLYQNMIRVWTYLFTPATFSVVAGLACIAYAVFKFQSLADVLLGAAGFSMVFWLYYRRFRPVLGTED